MNENSLRRLRELRHLIASEETSYCDRVAANRELAAIIERLCPPRHFTCSDPMDGQPWYVTVSGSISDDGSVTWDWNATRIRYEDHEWRWDFASADEAEASARSWFSIQDLGVLDVGSAIPDVPRYPGWHRLRIASPSRKYPRGRTVVGRSWHVARAIRDWMAAHGIQRPPTPPASSPRHQSGQEMSERPRQERIYSLTPLHIGFDPRVHDMPIALPTELDGLRLEADGKTYTVRGTRQQLIEAARAAGYQVVG